MSESNTASNKFMSAWMKAVGGSVENKSGSNLLLEGLEDGYKKDLSKSLMPTKGDPEGNWDVHNTASSEESNKDSNATDEVEVDANGHGKGALDKVKNYDFKGVLASMKDKLSLDPNKQPR